MLLCSSQCEWWGAGTGCPERLWIFGPWSCSRPGWMGPWATGSTTRSGGWWSCLCQWGWNFMILGVPSNPSHFMILWSWLFKYCVTLIELILKVIWFYLIWVILDILLAAVMLCGNAMATWKCWLSSRLSASCARSMNKQRILVPRVSVWHISQTLHSVTKKSQPVIRRKCYSEWVINFLLLTHIYTNSKETEINHALLNSEGKYALFQIFIIFILICFLLFMLFFVLASPCYSMGMSVCFLSVRCDFSLNQRQRYGQWSTRFELSSPKGILFWGSAHRNTFLLFIVCCKWEHNSIFAFSFVMQWFSILQSKDKIYIHLLLSIIVYILKKEMWWNL